VVALVPDAVISMWKKGVKDKFGFVIFLAALGVSLFTKLSPVLLVIAAAVAGLIIRSVKRASEAGKEAGK
jgi:chromate transporter